MEKTFVFVGNPTVGAMVAARLEEAGFARAASAADAGVAVTYCTSQTALEDAYFDEDGLVQHLASGSLLVDLSASTPGFARELNAVAQVSGLTAVEAPLVVADLACSDAFASKENLICLAGGEEDGLRAAMPVLEAIAGDVRDVGGPGAAQLARAAYTLQTVAQVVSAIESDALYRAVRRAGSFGPAQTGRAGATSPIAEQVLTAVAEGGFSGTYTVEMFMAELSAALTAADDADLILPQAEACLHLLELLAVIGGSDKAPAALSLVYGEEAACAEQGLDWTRAEQAYGDAAGHGMSCDEDGCGCEGHEHGYDADFDGYDLDDYAGYGDFPGYSAN